MDRRQPLHFPRYPTDSRAGLGSPPEYSRRRGSHAALPTGATLAVEGPLKMRVCVQGLWHLGCVTAACVAEHFQTTACDSEPQVIERLKEGHPPIFEPGLSERIAAAMAAQRLSFTSDLSAAVREADAVWVTLDTPVDDQDVADVDFVEREAAKVFPYLSDGTIVLISS